MFLTSLQNNKTPASDNVWRKLWIVSVGVEGCGGGRNSDH